MHRFGIGCGVLAIAAVHNVLAAFLRLCSIFVQVLFCILFQLFMLIVSFKIIVLIFGIMP